MANVLWGRDLELGVELLDNQHQELFERVNRLLEACRHRKGKEEAERLLDYLETYVVFHFEAEERYQRDAGFPGADLHREMHAAFRRSLADLRNKFAAEGTSLSLVTTIQSMVVDWLTRHIGVHDRAVVRYIASRPA